MVHVKLLQKIKEDLDYEKIHNKKNYELGESHLSVIAREIRERKESEIKRKISNA